VKYATINRATLIAKQTEMNYKKNPWTGPRSEILSDIRKGRIISHIRH